MGNSLRLWARHMTLLFKKLFWSPPHSKSILENLIHKYSLLLLWDTSHVIPFSFFFFACDRGRSVLAAWVSHVHFSIGWFCCWSPLCMVGRFFALCAQNRIKTQSSVA